MLDGGRRHAAVWGGTGWGAGGHGRRRGRMRVDAKGAVLLPLSHALIPGVMATLGRTRIPAHHGLCQCPAGATNQFLSTSCSQNYAPIVPHTDLSSLCDEVHLVPSMSTGNGFISHRRQAPISRIAGRIFYVRDHLLGRHAGSSTFICSGEITSLHLNLETPGRAQSLTHAGHQAFRVKQAADRAAAAPLLTWLWLDCPMTDIASWGTSDDLCNTLVTSIGEWGSTVPWGPSNSRWGGDSGWSSNARDWYPQNVCVWRVLDKLIVEVESPQTSQIEQLWANLNCFSGLKPNFFQKVRIYAPYLQADDFGLFKVDVRRNLARNAQIGKNMSGLTASECEQYKYFLGHPEELDRACRPFTTQVQIFPPLLHLDVHPGVCSVILLSREHSTASTHNFVFGDYNLAFTKERIGSTGISPGISSSYTSSFNSTMCQILEIMVGCQCPRLGVKVTAAFHDFALGVKGNCVSSKIVGFVCQRAEWDLGNTHHMVSGVSVVGQ
ncbi:hypothetical protein C8R45DRAFT_928696 [Mycena sanguinolenta]|nr:hypothetical protein C8R45DRAFT_928696 [Mycena sanguinolenta]